MRKKIIIVSFIAVLVFGFTYFVYSQNERKKRNELYRQLELFSDGLSLVEAEFVDEPKSRDLIYGALKGMLSSLDSYSEFLDPESRKELEVGTEGEFGGLGIEITIKDELLTVMTPIEDTPAWKAGLKSGDRIVKINAEVTRNITASEAVKKLRGKPGTEVALTILREDKSGAQGRFFEVKITRDIIKVKDIKNTSILEDNIGYIRLVEFRKNTPADLDTALAQLKKSGMNGLILDLRNNPGGLLDVAVKTVDRFIPTGKVVVSTKGRLAAQNMEYKSANGAKYLDIPMVLIVNEGSASGSEIVAGALQDYKRAVLIGTKTFGKGAVQSVLPLSDGSALKLTTSKWFTPGGRLIHTQGIVPDIVVEADKSPSGDGPDFSAGPADVERVFETLKEKAQGAEKEQPKNKEFDYKKDNQVVRAIDIIKGIKVYKTLQP